jgi:serine/threonine-protein kinase
MAGDPRVLGLLEEMLDSGRAPEEVCRDCPELLPEVRRRWQQFGSVDAQLGALFPASGTAADAKLTAPGLPRVPGYEVEAELGHGGMGVVYRARHLALKRTVALKMLLADGHTQAAARGRFLVEAEAVAQLQHPNIVQIHEIGEADGLPYLALEYVEGGSLSRRLAGRPLPPNDAARLVEALAEAMHLAHSRNLVHCDLKPANVLLTGGADTPVGQCRPKVSDFGLARQLDDLGRTPVGPAMGTPSYMAPEQTEGRGHAAGPAADVYALGAVLYECLTGRPPFQGVTPLETLLQVRTREPAAPSALNRQVPRDLEAICLKCLRKQPERRYSSARELADDLGRFLRGEPVAARPVGVAESAWKWVRRRPAAAGLLAAVALLVVAGGVGAWLLAAARARQAQTDQEVRGALGRGRSLLEEGWQAADLAKLTAARAEGDRAEGIARSGGASAALRQQAAAFREEAAGRLGRARKDRALLEAVLDVSSPQETWASTHGEAGQALALAEPGADEQYAAAFRRWGLDVDATPEAEVVARLGDAPAVVVQELIGALDGWMLVRRQLKRPEAEWRRLYRLADRLDSSERHRRLRALLVGEIPPRAQSVAGLAGAASPWPALWELARGNAWRQLLEAQKEIDPRKEPALTIVLLAQACAAAGDTAGAEKLLRRATTARPGQVVLLNALGKLLERQRPPRYKEAVEYYRAARGQRRHLGLALSKALLGAGRPAEAEEVLRELAPRQTDAHNPAFYFYFGTSQIGQQRYREAEAAYRKALELKPDLAAASSNLGVALSSQQRYAEAEAAYRKALELKPDLAEAYIGLAYVHLRRGEHGEAEAACRKALELKPHLAEAYTNLSNALLGQERPGEAEAACRKALELKPDLAEAHNSLGSARMGQQRYAEAEAALRKAVALRPVCAEFYNNLGSALNRQKKYGEAEEALRKAVGLKPDLAEAHYHLGNALSERGRRREAVLAFQTAIDLKPDFAGAYFNLGNVELGQQKYAAAEAAYRKAVEIQPDHAEAHTNLGGALLSQGKQREAEATLRQAVRLNPRLPEAHQNLGVALMARGKHREAEPAFQKAIDLKPDSAGAYYCLGNARLGQQRFGEAEAAYRKAVGLKADHAEAYNNLGFVLMQQARFDEAGAALKKAAELLTAPGPRFRARRLERECQRYRALEARLPAILQGKEKPADAAELRDLAELCRLKQHYAAAARFARETFTAGPQQAGAVPGAARYNAACAAALAGCGQGKDADRLDDKARARWRRQALDWLRQDLTGWGQALDQGDARTDAEARQLLRHWRVDPDLAGVRAGDALARLPEEERKQWERLWSDADALLRRVSRPE